MRSRNHRADGYTLLMGLHATQAILVHLQKLPYDPAKDFAPVIHVATVPNVLLVHNSVPANSLQRIDRLRQGQSRTSLPSRRKATARPAT